MVTSCTYIGTTVMTKYWFLLVAFAIISVYPVRCDTHPDSKTEDKLSFSDTIVGFKPCLDESCESYGPTVLEEQAPKHDAGLENPKVHCIFLRPSAVKMFGAIESMHPGISEVKYRVFEELIDHMYSFASLEMEGCHSAMKLVDLIILAGNSLKAQYTLQDGEECIFKSSEYQTVESVPGYEKTEMPCFPVSTESSEYTTDVPTICLGSTIAPEPVSPPTEKPYVPSYPEHPTTEKPYIPEPTKQPVTEKPYYPSSTEEPVKKPCPGDATTEKPCDQYGDVTEEYSAEEIEIVAEDEKHVEIPQVGSMRGVPGVHYPNYKDIPITSFSCADKKYIPGFYADLETGCQVFHVCYEHRRESFLCPVGTIFNQPILACDYWYSSNCSLASHYYDVNGKTELKEEKIDEEVEELLTLIVESEKSQEVETKTPDAEIDLDKITQFFPVKAVVTDIKPEIKVPAHPAPPKADEFASVIVGQMATTATKIMSGMRDTVASIPEPPKIKPIKMEDLLKTAVVPLAKAKLAAIPVSKITALKTAVPVASLAAKVKIAVPVAAAKAKLATKVAAIPTIKFAASATIPVAKAAVATPILAKGKFAAAAPIIAKGKFAAAAPIIAKGKFTAAAPIIPKGKFAVPAVKAAAAKVAVKSTIPALKTKMVASAVPLAKSKIVPLMKAKVVSSGAPLLKAKMLALPLAKSKLAGPIPLAKVKLAKAAAISPLTKKALALGYMKLLKAKKLALMG